VPVPRMETSVSLRVAGGVLASLALLSPLAPSSRALAADTTPPNPGTVNDSIGSDQDTQDITTHMTASWSGFFDPEWPSLEYALAIGTRPCGTEARGFQSVGADLSYTASGLSLTRGQRYYVTIRAINGVGLSTYVSSDGILVLLADGSTGGAPAAEPGGVCTPDLSPPDAGTPDSGTPGGGADGGTPDGGADGGTPDGGAPDDGSGELEPVLGWGCGASGGSGGLALLALSALGLALSRRRAPLPRR
jgi:uncharacterized protein (TIGR03382 family)